MSFTFAVGAPRLRSGVWSVSTWGSDIYFSASSLGGQVKASIHLRGPKKDTEFRWVNFATPEIASDTALGQPVRGRRLHVWHGLQISERFTLEVRLRIPHRAMCAMKDEEGLANVNWIPEPPAGCDVEAVIVHGVGDAKIGIRGTPGPIMGVNLGTLTNGEQVWVLHYPVQEASHENITERREQALRHLPCDLRSKLDPSVHRIMLMDDHGDGSLSVVDLSLA